MSAPLSDAVLDLLIERELYGLSALSESDRAQVARASKDEESPSVAHLMALIDMEFTEREDLPPLNHGLRAALLSAAMGTPVPIVARKRNFREMVAWTAAAAALIFAFFATRAGDSGSGEALDLGARLQSLVAEADCVRKPWEAVAPAFSGVRGEVVWSHERSEGYMIFEGLPANDRTKSQYQLWIIDPERDSKPMDGGLFDISDTGSQVIVPIQQKLAVRRPQAFIITEEQPGGVVVSDGPFLLKAALPN